MKYIPGIVIFVIGLFFYALTFSGDNPDAKALSGVLYIPAIICGIVSFMLTVAVILL